MSENTAKFADQFLPIFQRAAVTATGERERIKAEITKLNTQRAELDVRIKSLERQLDALESDIAVALKHAAREAGLKLDIGTHQPAAKASAATPGKSAEAERAAAVSWLKQNKGKHTGGEIRKGTGITRNVAILLRDVKEVKSEGERRSKVYWVQQ
jgi:chromosome segregation ATPase